jgi:hypothetical protein
VADRFPSGHCETRREPLSDYLASDAFISSSNLRRFDRLGLTAPQLPNGGTVQGNIMGEALHALVLEPDTFATHYLVPGDAQSAQPEISEQETMQRQSLDAWQWSTLCHARDALLASTQFPVASWLSQGEKELSIYWSDEAGAMWKARPDCFTEDVVLDLKTTGDIRPDAFRRTRERLDYDVQAAHYIEAVSRLGGKDPRFAFVAVELTEPYSVGVHELDTAELSAARARLADLKTGYLAAVAEANVG